MELKKNGILEQILEEVSSTSEKGILEQMLEKMDEMNKRLINLEDKLIPKFNLTKRADVKKYLNISESTLNNMFKDGRLQIAKHYIKEIKGKKTKITFIESGILDFKEKKKNY